jgi:hypothetical protein
LQPEQPVVQGLNYCLVWLLPVLLPLQALLLPLQALLLP